MKFEIDKYYKYTCDYGKGNTDTGKIIIFKVLHLYHLESKSQDFITGYTEIDFREGIKGIYENHIVYFPKSDIKDVIEMDKDDVVLELL